MIKHIVMWELRNKADAEIIKDNLEALAGKIPGLLSVEVGIDFSDSEQSADVVLYSELESREALAAYQSHPDHAGHAVYGGRTGALQRGCQAGYRWAGERTEEKRSQTSP